MLKTIFVLLCFVIASYYDIKIREVSNKLWLVMLPLGVVFFSYELLLSSFTVLTSFLITATFALGCWKFKQFGGADSKAIIIIGLFYPYWMYGVPFAILATSIGCATIIIFYGIQKKFHFKEHYPLIPFFTVGMIILQILRFINFY